MPFNTYLFIIERILATIDIPLSVDLEMGYALSTDDIYTNILSLIDLGVAGINIEDSTIERGARALKHAPTFADTLREIKNRLIGDDLQLFINVRCDTYLTNNAPQTRERLNLYEQSGADGIFLPCIYNPAISKKLSRQQGCPSMSCTSPVFPVPMTWNN